MDGTGSGADGTGSGADGTSSAEGVSSAGEASSTEGPGGGESRDRCTYVHEFAGDGAAGDRESGAGFAGRAATTSSGADGDGSGTGGDGAGSGGGSGTSEGSDGDAEAAAEGPGEPPDRWECPHAAHPAADRCVFHLPVERREELGIDPGAVSAAFVAAVAVDGPGPGGDAPWWGSVPEASDGGPEGGATRGFVGARFRELAVEYRALGGRDRTPIDLRAAEVEELRVTESTVRAAVDCSGATVGECSLIDSEFERGLSLSGATVAGGTDLRRSRFDGPVRAEGATLSGPTAFAGARFEARASFADCEFTDRVVAEEVVFGHDASFEGATLRGRAGFTGAEFTGGANVVSDDADFSGATFAGPAAFGESRFRYADFGAATFEADAAFPGASFARGGSFADAAFGADADFERTTFDGTADFEGAAVAGTAGFTESVFGGDAVFRDARFSGPATFAGGAFRGGSSLGLDDADFSGAVFEAAADFHLAAFRYAEFEDARFGADLDLSEAAFDQGARLTGAAVAGDLDCYRARFSGRVTFAGADLAAVDFDEAVFDDDADFSGATLSGPAGFRGTAFNGGAKLVDDADFSGTVFGDEADFGEADFRHGTFDDATFRAGGTFHRTAFERGAEFRDAAVEGPLDATLSSFGGASSFDGARFSGPAEFDEAVFDDDASFAAARFEAPARFRGVEFNGGANVRADDADFSGTVFEGGATFDRAFFRHGNFDEATVGGPTAFEGAEFDRGLSMDGTRLDAVLSLDDAHLDGTVRLAPDPVGERALVSVREAHLENGVVADTGPVYYDATQATVGEVEFVDRTPETNVFDRVLFRNTDFHGFDFSLHRGYLTENDWRIHDVDIDPGAFETDRFEADPGPEDLETTYLKAKTGAKALGDNKAVSEFFVREMSYRRAQYRRILRDRDRHGPLTALKAAGRWATNRFFDLSCGYGERPSRVVLASVVIVLAFGALYDYIDIALNTSGALAPYVYSVEAYTTIIVGDPPKVTTATDMITATEGFVGGFFVALFVFALTRSIHR